jgi:ribonuclease HII
MIVVGVDENGLGPLLGPLVTTAASFEVARYSPERHASVGRALGIDDSKSTAGFGQMAVAEGLALALVEALHGTVVSSIDALFECVLLDAPTALQAPCPTSSHPQCWSVPLALPCFGGELEAGRAMLRGLGKRGVRPAHLRSALSCTGDLNRRLRKGQSRVEVDLELMERLVLDARAQAKAEVRAVCGMVGGIRNYTARMRHFPLVGLKPVRALGGTLAYDVVGVGHVRFEIDADARHLPVALASMVGKYVRELWMERQNRFYRAADGSLADVSGYHDPVTQRFIVASAPLRVALGIDDACFLRKSARHLIDEAADAQLSLL